MQDKSILLVIDIMEVIGTAGHEHAGPLGEICNLLVTVRGARDCHERNRPVAAFLAYLRYLPHPQTSAITIKQSQYDHIEPSFVTRNH